MVGDTIIKIRSTQNGDGEGIECKWTLGEVVKFSNERLKSKRLKTGNKLHMISC
ncbi:hypothetical protein glysoja_015706 [Glycine soja]|nr:hypothetical protein glysoja_015706 [Glycine soja]